MKGTSATMLIALTGCRRVFGIAGPLPGGSAVTSPVARGASVYRGAGAWIDPR